DRRARAFGPRYVRSDLGLVRLAEKVAGVSMSTQQFLNASPQSTVGSTRLIQKTKQLAGIFVVQRFEKDRLGIGLYVAHGYSPIMLYFSQCPVCGENPPRNVGKFNRCLGCPPGADAHTARRGHRPIGAPPSAGQYPESRRRL